MPLKGEYEPSKAQFVRDQVELYESSGGTQGTTLSVLVAREEDERLRDLPVVILTTLGAKSGKIRKTPVMRVEHDGVYAIIASMAGAPKHPVWYHNAVADPRVEPGRPGAPGNAGPRGDRAGEDRVVGPSRRGVPRLRRVPEEHGPRDPGPRSGTGGPRTLTRQPVQPADRPAAWPRQHQSRSSPDSGRLECPMAGQRAPGFPGRSTSRNYRGIAALGSPAYDDTHA